MTSIDQTSSVRLVPVHSLRYVNRLLYILITLQFLTLISAAIKAS